MLSPLPLFILGLIALVFGATLLVRGASRLAVSWGISPLVVGLTVVAFGTSTPELAASVGASLSGLPDLALGNVVGSNIANVLIILGLSAVIIPLLVHEQIIRREVPIMIATSLVVLLMAWNGSISQLESMLLLAVFVAYTVFLIVGARTAGRETGAEYASELPKGTWDQHWAVQVALVGAGLALLVLGADWLVGAATTIATALGMSELIIGLTLVAIGTSMPEIATSLIAALRGERDIAVGNVVGSNIFNLLAVLGAAGLVSEAGLAVPAGARYFDLWVMLATAIACLPILITGRLIARWEGALFLAYYAAYVFFLVFMTQNHDALSVYGNGIMLAYVVPLFIVTLVASFIARGQDGGKRQLP